MTEDSFIEKLLHMRHEDFNGLLLDVFQPDGRASGLVPNGMKEQFCLVANARRIAEISLARIQRNSHDRP